MLDNEDKAVKTALTEKASALKGKRREIADTVLSCAYLKNHGFIADDKIPGQLLAFMVAGVKPGDVLPAKGDVYQTVAAFVGAKPAELLGRLCNYLNCQGKLPFPHKFYVKILLDYIAAVNDGFSLEAWLDEKEKGSEGRHFAGEGNLTVNLISMFLDDAKEAPGLLERLGKIINDDSGIGTVDVAMIRGIMRSDNAGAHDLAGKLLAVAKLQEGLRQTILEAAGSGSGKAFERIFKQAVDQDLFRFTSAMKTFCQWVKLDFEPAALAKLKKAAASACQCLTDPAFRKDSLEADDPIRVYLALWALRRVDLEAAYKAVPEILAAGPRQRKAAALQAVRKFLITRSLEAARIIFSDPGDRADVLLTALAVACLQAAPTSAISARVGASEDSATHPDDAIRWRGQSSQSGWRSLGLSPDQARVWYGHLRAVADSFAAGADKTRTSTLDLGAPIPLAYSLDDILRLMETILGRDKLTVPITDTGGGRSLSPGPQYTSVDPAYIDRRDPAEFWGIIAAEARVRDARSVRQMFGPLTFVRDELDDDPADANLRDDLCRRVERMEPDTRRELLNQVVRNGEGSQVQRDTLIGLMCDRSVTGFAAGYVSLIKLTQAERLRLEDALRYKDGKLRQRLYYRLLDYQPAELGAAVQRLLASKDAMQRAGGKDLLAIMERRKDDLDYAEIYNDCLAATPAEAAAAPNPERLYNEENGFGLYDPSQEPTRFDIPEMFHVDRELPGQELLGVTREEIAALLAAIQEIISAHKGMEYRTRSYDGTILTKIITNDYLSPDYREGRPVPNRRGGNRLADYPLADEWQAMLQRLKVTPACAVVINLLGQFPILDESGNNLNLLGEVKDNVVPAPEWAKYAASLRGEFMNSTYGTIVQMLPNEFPPTETYAVLRRLIMAYMRLPVQFGNRGYYGGQIEQLLSKLVLRAWQAGDAEFTDYFRILHEWSHDPRGPGLLQNLPTARDFSRAQRLGLLPDNDILRGIVRIGRAAPFNDLLAGLTSPPYFAETPTIGRSRRYISPREVDEQALPTPVFQDMIERIVKRTLEVEIPRGETPTPLSRIAEKIEAFTGVKYFVDILAHSGADPFDRTMRDGTRKAMLSRLIRHCHPGPDEDAALLGRLLKEHKVSDPKLLDGAMFAPQWLPLAAEYLGWPGLESACWYFHAHVNERFSAEKETQVARYSSIDPYDFKDGAFDIDWFKEAYATLGAKRFANVYAAAKYIGAGANHRRAQLFADAVNGKVTISEAEKAITEKRNQSYMLCYGLIPLNKKKREQDMLERYLTLQHILKPDKKIGPQRRESEARAVSIGLDNLARNAGYDNTVAFSWKMEAAQADQNKLFEPRSFGDGGEVTARLELGPDGGLDTKIEKKGKALKSVPAKLKKDPEWLELQDAVKSWKDQRSRTRKALERAMIHGEVFELADLAKLSVNPAFKDFLNKLIFKMEDRLDFLSGLLADKPAGKASVAHPWHLKEAGEWPRWQRELFDRQISQPFKQVFRELYLPTADELKDQATGSKRYAGHQVQLTQGMGLLKSRGWTVNYDYGIQKVFLKENLIVQLDAPYSWFSPQAGDIPTLEEVSFRERRKGTLIPLTEVPPLLFSEIMRDLDLLVSVAYVGGVDPEASESTLEMRLAIAKEAVRLFKLKNVSFKQAHAIIKGTRGEYTLHLGSGAMHLLGRGALVVASVPQQHQGRLFLPFIDDDPRTAEVVAKILAFAKDGELKDPTLLTQLEK